jgi:pyruvate,water dikinase
VTGEPVLEPLTRARSAAEAGAKAARLSVALGAGLPVLPGWVLPVAASRPAIAAGAAAIRVRGMAAGRRAVLGHPFEPALAHELQAAVTGLGGRVIARSSSPLEGDPRWSGAFSSVAEVGVADVAAAVRSCWAAAFALDPLQRLERCGLPLEVAELAVLLQPEISPDAGGLARVAVLADGEAEVTIEAVAGHPGTLLAGLADGLTGRFRAAAAGSADDGPLVSLIGVEQARAVARLALAVHRELGDTLIEWAAVHGEVWLLQSGCQPAGAAQGTPAGLPGSAAPAGLPHSPGSDLRLETLLSQLSRESVVTLAETVQARGCRLTATAASPGATAGRLVACRQHEPPPDCRDAVLLIDRPLPSYAPLLFGARGVIARSGAASSHLAQVARSLGVPMVVGCRVETVTGAPPPAAGWLVAVDGGTGEVALLALR